MSVPSITVLMTVYNGGSYLHLAVKSVLEQTYKDFEFLIIDDRGTDGSLEFLKSIQDSRIRIHSNPQNIGQTKSLNVGLGIARGQYIARMDADDIAKPQWLENLVVFLAKNSGCAVVSPLAAAINSSGKFSRVLNSPRTKEDIILKSLFISPINHVGSLMRRKVIVDDMRGYDEQFKVAADYDLWSRLLRQGYQLELYPKVLVSIRFHAQSSTAIEMGKKVIPEMSRIMQENIEYWKKLKIDQESVTLLWRLIYTPEILILKQYQEGLNLLNRIYGSCDFLKKQRKIVLVKRLLGKIKRRFALKRQSC